MAQDITSWGEMKQVLRELKKPESKEMFQSIIIDTVDLAADMCQKYICNQLGIDNIGDGGWTNNGWSKYKKEFEDTFRTLAQMGYAIVFISHDKEKTIKPQNGTEYQQIGSSVQSSALSVIENMSDIIAYAHPKILADGTSHMVLTLRSPDNSVRCGCRFKYIDNEIDFTYDALVKALNKAIDKEAEITNGRFVTDEKQQVSAPKEYNFEEMMGNFQNLASALMEQNQSNAAKITAIVERYLGKGKKAGDCSPSQCEQLELILIDLKDLLN
jgi:hypothetical protein